MPPDVNDLAEKEASTEGLKESFRKRQDAFCDPKKVVESVISAALFPEDQETCWICWMRLTKQDLTRWRNTVYNSKGAHDSICPVCGYTHWNGGIWYPYKYLKREGGLLFGNPSVRHSEAKKERV